jgi:putative nucleotidyltransferase with HDIG domain
VPAHRWLTRARIATGIALLGSTACTAWVLLEDSGQLVDPLTVILIAAAVVANVGAAEWSDGRIAAGGSFVASMLAVAFVGPGGAFAVAAIAELVAWLVERYRTPVLPINVFSSGGPDLLAGVAFTALALDPRSLVFYLALAAVACGALLLNVVVLTTLVGPVNGGRFAPKLDILRGIVPALLITVAMTVAAAAVYERAGIAGALFVLVTIFAFTYMARLVVTARERTRQYAALSWGVLSGLIRTLDLRDARAARHAAAVAAFSRDIAQAVGMSSQECELAHTAGLLHDIGRFGLSDRVMERGRTLTEQDWETIRRHPEMGADLLRDLGIYGPVAEIVRSHHERIDGRGYPRGLAADEIPELAKIVSVAEVYDTLTADDTYRTPVSSFEALNELRRVSGSQLDGRYVEALAELLAGRGVEYRHADRADFDEELDVQRRISEAVGAPQPEEAEAAGSGD